MKTCKGCKHYKRSERSGVKCCELGLHESYCEKDKEDFAIEELEKIKAEIDDLKKALHIWLIDRDDLIDECSEIIDKHISELKGE